MSMPISRIAAAVGTLLLGLSTQGQAQEVTGHATYVDNNGQVVHCVSTDNGRSYCGAPHTRYVMAGNPPTECVQGNTWGFDDRGVWVSGGCHADFTVAAGNDVTARSSYVADNGGVVHCVSTESGRTYCGHSHVRYVIKEPSRVCVEGRNWGTDERGVWVSSGCTADFGMQGDGDATTTTTTTTRTTDRTYVESSKVVHCIATESGRTYCGAPHNRYVIAGDPDPACVEGSTWGFEDDRGVWVSGNCKADFRIDKDD